MAMDIFVVKAVPIELPATLEPFTVDVPVAANFGTIQQEVEGTPEFQSRQQRYVYQVASLPAIMQTFHLRISRIVGAGNANVEVTAYGPPLAQFMNRYRNKRLRMIFEGFFMQGFVLLIPMDPKYDRGFENGRSRYFQGSIPILQTSRFGRGNFSLEIVDQEVRDFSRYAHPIPPVVRVLQSSQHTDFILRSADGHEFPCLRSFLSVSSPTFEVRLSSATQENRDGIAEIPASHEVVNAFLKYVYYADMTDPCRCLFVAMELLRLSIMYNMAPLSNSLKHLLLSKPVGGINFDSALRMFFATYRNADMVELKEKALGIIRSRRDQLGASSFLQTYLHGNEELMALWQQL